MPKYLILLMVIILIFSCAGNKPRPEWSASQYFQYAKKMFDEEDYYEASNEFTVVVLRYAGSTVADSAQYYLGESHFMMDEFLVAAVEYEKLVNNMSRSPLVPLAQYKLGECYYNLSPRPSLDQKYTEKAIREYQNFIEENPTHRLKAEAEKKIALLRDKLAEKMWINADIYRKMRKYNSAIIYFDQVLEKYYDSQWSDDASVGKIETYVDMENYIVAKKEIEKFTEQFSYSELKKKVDEFSAEIQKNLAEDSKANEQSN